MVNGVRFPVSTMLLLPRGLRFKHIAKQLTATDIHINDNHYPKPCNINDYLKTKKVVHSRTTFIKPQRKC